MLDMHIIQPKPMPALQLASIQSTHPVILAELVGQLPLAASHFGMVLRTALGHKSDLQSECPEEELLHYRATPVSVSGCTEENASSVIDITITDYAVTFHGRCESRLMQAAILEGAPDQAGLAGSSDHATANNMDMVLKNEKTGPVARSYYQTVLAVILELIERRSAMRRLSDKDGDQGSPHKFYCINDIWKPALASLARFEDGVSEGVKFVVSEKDLLTMEPEIRLKCQQLEKEEGLVLGSMIEGDVKLMLELNHVKYDEPYGHRMIRQSQCFRDKTGKPVAWAGTHEDFAIACLYVLPEYRKLGLGRLVLLSLALIHVRLAREALSANGVDTDSIPTTALYAHADCLNYNQPTMVFMERCGWGRIGNFIWLGLYPKERSDQESF
ncbi:hypothetical protein BG011_003818 [Mortierella polycephala]|uniref:N-acetyltransferase domain-containing protein n=1 Tax=Mortierella polycephala TaxID=41804 RepID=A0A9P6U9Z7_9FUNG|nr:hypothetical protein BG011_003818 [Mortierella polycephala]